MKFSIKTAVFKEMVSRAVKGASCDKLIPLTSLMAIQVKSKKLTLITTDASNTLYIMQDLDADDFYCVVQVDQFSKLIARMTSENISLECDDSILTVIGNGTYKIELQPDENGEPIQFPDPASELKIKASTKLIEVNLATIKTILSVNKASLATTDAEPAYTGYYVGEKVVTTNRDMICGYAEKLFNVDVLISPEMMNLLDVMTEEKIGVYMKDDIIEFITKDCIVFGNIMEEIENFSIELINNFLDEEFESSCKISKTDFLALLDRISLFVGAYDNSAIMLTFTDKGIDVSSKQSNGVETIGYIEVKNFKPYTCMIDVLMLTQQVKVNRADSIQIQFGNDNSIKIVDDNVTQVIALYENA